jgi:hypothetical protein
MGKFVRFVEFFDGDCDKLVELYLLQMPCVQKPTKSHIV